MNAGWPLLCAFALLTPVAVSAEDDGLAARLTQTAKQLRNALTEAERSDALYPFDDDEREDIRFAPLLLDGARHGEMGDAAATLTEQLLALSLSPRGLETARLIRRNELAVRKKDEAGWAPDWLLRRFRIISSEKREI